MSLWTWTLANKVWYREFKKKKKKKPRWYQYIRLCTAVGFLAFVICILFCGRGVGESQIIWGILEVYSLNNHFLKCNFKMHYDLLQKYIFFCLLTWLLHFVISWTQQLICCTAWLHEFIQCTYVPVQRYFGFCIWICSIDYYFCILLCLCYWNCSKHNLYIWFYNCFGTEKSSLNCKVLLMDTH